MKGRVWDAKDGERRNLESAEQWDAGFEAVPGSEAGFWTASQAVASFLEDLRESRMGEAQMSGTKSGETRSRRGGSLRPDTALAPVGAPQEERYITAIPACCLRSLKHEALAENPERRRLALECGCGREWWITSTLDERVARRFVTHGGPRVSGDGHSAA